MDGNDFVNYKLLGQILHNMSKTLSFYVLNIKQILKLKMTRKQNKAGLWIIKQYNYFGFQLQITETIKKENYWSYAEVYLPVS